MSRAYPCLRRFLRETRGAALVEFALVLPVLLIFLGVIVEGGRIAWTYQAASGGVRDATRMIARTAPLLPCPGNDLDALRALAADRVDAAFAASVAPERAAITDVAVTMRCVALDGLDARVAVVAVRADVRIDLIFGAVLGFGGADAGPVVTTITDEARVFGL